jgi:hypothetical protein
MGGDQHGPPLWPQSPRKAADRGIDVAFLEETFSGRTDNPNHRLHRKAARAVLATLISEQDGDIKGGMRHYRELVASGYERYPKDFDALLHILDSRLRLITPTQPEGLRHTRHCAATRVSHTESDYHLAHDYLVPSLHEWLASRQKQSWRGRSELLLAEQACIWSARPTTHNLPSFLEWLNILFFTTSRMRAKEQQNRRFVRAASRYFASRLLIAVALVVIVVWPVDRRVNRSRAEGLVESLRSAHTQEVPAIMAWLQPLRKWADLMLATLA